MLELTRNGVVEYLPESDQEEAMRLFWTAKREGDTTANLKRVPGDPPENDPPEPDPPAQAVLAVPTEETTPAGLVSAVAVNRIQLQEQWLEEAGFQLAPPLFAPGTRVLPLGDQNFRMERRRVGALPRFDEAADQVVASIRSEERQEIIMPLSELSMGERGELLIDDQPYGLEASAFHQVASLAGFGSGARYLARMCSSELRATNVNEQLGKVHHRKQVVLRARADGSGRRVVFAAVTPTYSVCDTDEVLAAVVGDLAEARTEMRYDGSGVRATALFMPDTVVDLAAGDVFKAGVRISTDDTGRGRIRITAVVFRNQCLNLIVIQEGSVETVSQVHRGSPERILQTVRTGVQEARSTIASFLEAWGHARTVKVDPESQFNAWLTRGQVKLPIKEKRQDTLEVLMRALSKEPGDTLADAVNAVTRAAHEHRPWGQEVRETLERQASQLVYAAA